MGASDILHWLLVVKEEHRKQESRAVRFSKCYATSKAADRFGIGHTSVQVKYDVNEGG